MKNLDDKDVSEQFPIICGGMNCCENRNYDSTKDDCSDCLNDYTNAMKITAQYFKMKKGYKDE